MTRKKPSPKSPPELLVEMIVLWGHGPDAEVLHVGYVDPAHGFSVGDDGDREDPPDFVIDRAQLGCERLTIVAPPDALAPREIAGHPLLCVPEGAGVYAIDERGQHRSAAQLLIDGGLCSNKNRALPLACPLVPGTTAWLLHRNLTFVVRTTAPAQIDAKPVIEWKAQRYLGFSFAAHLFLLGLFYYSPPAAASASNDLLHLQQRYLPIALDGYELEELPPEIPEGASDQGKAAQGDRGTHGEPDADKPRAKDTKIRRGDSQEPERSRQEQVAMAAQAGIISVLQKSTLLDGGVLTSGTSGAHDAYDALASLLSSHDGPSFGNGLAANGTGRGGGGSALGTIGSGPLGTIGVGDGLHGHGRYGRGVKDLRGRAPIVPVKLGKEGVLIVGGLSKETIRRTINRRINEIRYCYEQALVSRPELQGRVAVRFVIAPSGLVQRAAVASSDVGNAALEACVVRAVERFVFDAPEGSGIVSVSYPFVFQQTGS